MQLVEQGVHMPYDWELSDKQALYNAIAKVALHGLQDAFRKNIIEVTGFYLPPSLSAEEFVQSADIQRQLQHAMEVSSNQAIVLSWTPEELHQNILKPRFVADYEARRQELLATSAELADGGARAEQGRQYFRSIIVPPIAMGFSLFFGLLNLFALTAAVLCMARVSPLKSKLVAYTLGGGVFFVWPLLIPSNVVTSKAFNYFRIQMDSSLPAVASLAATWAVDSQPVLYPLGHWFAGIVHQSALESMLTPKQPATEQGQTNNVRSQVVIDNQRELAAEQQATTEPQSQMLHTNAAGIASEKASVILGRSGVLTESSYFPFSLKGLEESLGKGNGLTVDLMPIGNGDNRDFVIYNRPIVGNDVCIRGRRALDSLYHLKSVDWLSGTHGNCNTPINETSKLPSVERYFSAIQRLSESRHTVLYTFHSPLTGEVYCRDIYEVLKKASKYSGKAQAVFSTPSEAILGCFQSYPETIDFGFEFPAYETGRKMPENVDHSLLSIKEWKRINKSEEGETQGIDRIPTSYFDEILKNHGRMTFALIDEAHDSKALEDAAQLNNIKLSTFTDETINWVTENQ